MPYNTGCGVEKSMGPKFADPRMDAVSPYLKRSTVYDTGLLIACGSRLERTPWQYDRGLTQPRTFVLLLLLLKASVASVRNTFHASLVCLIIYRLSIHGVEFIADELN